MSIISELLSFSNVHDEWHELLSNSLQSVDTEYLKNLMTDDEWLPGTNRLFSAFQRDRQHCQYILFGESPYPRKQSANGIAFYDAAVNDIWSVNGLSKTVNRATSLRNIIKTALIAEQHIQALTDGSVPQSLIANINKQNLVPSIDALFLNFSQAGFLMFNATPVLHPQRTPRVEARYWIHFIEQLLNGISQSSDYPMPTLVLWGKISQLIQQIPSSSAFKQIQCEHPYNLSFIHHPAMLKLFSRIKIMQRENNSALKQEVFK